MKKLMFAVSYIVLAAGLAYAGTQYDWANGNGGKFITPDPTTMQLGQALLVGSTIYPEVRTSSTSALGLGSFTTAQIKAYTPTAVGQIVYNSDSPNGSTLCISTGTGVGAFAVVSSTGKASLCN